MSNRLRVALQGELGSFSSVAAYQLLGEDLDQLIAQMKACNPSYKFSGSQAAFLESLR